MPGVTVTGNNIFLNLFFCSCPFSLCQSFFFYLSLFERRTIRKNERRKLSLCSTDSITLNAVFLVAFIVFRSWPLYRYFWPHFVYLRRYNQTDESTKSHICWPYTIQSNPSNTNQTLNSSIIIMCVAWGDGRIQLNVNELELWSQLVKRGEFKINKTKRNFFCFSLNFRGGTVGRNWFN